MFQILLTCFFSEHSVLILHTQKLYKNVSESKTFQSCLPSGAMSDHMSHSPIPNGYQQRISPCSSPGGLSSTSPNMMVHNGSNILHHKASPNVTPAHTPTPQLRPSPSTHMMGTMRPDHLNLPEVSYIIIKYEQSKS